MRGGIVLIRFGAPETSADESCSMIVMCVTAPCCRVWIRSSVAFSSSARSFRRGRRTSRRAERHTVNGRAVGAVDACDRAQAVPPFWPISSDTAVPLRAIGAMPTSGARRKPAWTKVATTFHSRSLAFMASHESRSRHGAYLRLSPASKRPAYRRPLHIVRRFRYRAVASAPSRRNITRTPRVRRARRL